MNNHKRPMVQVTKNTTQAWERMLFPFIPLHSPSFQVIFPSFPVRSPSFQNPNRRLKTSSFGAQKRDWASKGSKSHLVIEQSSRGRRGKFGPNFNRNILIKTNKNSSPNLKIHPKIQKIIPKFKNASPKNKI